MSQQHYYTHWVLPDKARRLINWVLNRYGIPVYEGRTNSPDLRVDRKGGGHADDKPYWRLNPIITVNATDMTEAEIRRYEAANIRHNKYPFNDAHNDMFDRQGPERKAILANPSSPLVRWDRQKRRVKRSLQPFGLGFLVGAVCCSILVSLII